MDIATIIASVVDLINKVGFPIAMCCVFVYMWREEVANHKEESLRFAQALEENTEVMRRLSEVIQK